MRPRFFKRGKAQDGAIYGDVAIASMRPRFFKRGKKQSRAISTVTAVMLQ